MQGHGKRYIYIYADFEEEKLWRLVLWFSIQSYEVFTTTKNNCFWSFKASLLRLTAWWANLLETKKIVSYQWSIQFQLDERTYIILKAEANSQVVLILIW